MLYAGKPLDKISFGPLQSYFWTENMQTIPNFQWSNVLEIEKYADVKNQGK